ncbi:MAG: hypothetical protein B7Y80_01830 [Hyphomicrobium sp. 32-62-53]|nr:MAG: hypothetical protein B7Z29_02180 [Hyphomicrobium sp. 12-62-95]OYY01490.1 MAG: hypothetical protein B7Y80_01830 [Hyphomicrobium sp. 32-62-53]
MSTQNETSNTHESKQQPDQMTPETVTTDTVQPLPSTAEMEIATGLKRLYGQMLAEPIPDKFAGLLEQLAKLDREPEQPK